MVLQKLRRRLITFMRLITFKSDNLNMVLQKLCRWLMTFTKLITFKREKLDMAGGLASCSPSPAPFSSSDSKKHHVFISFRGEDTRENFTSHLYGALHRNQIPAYRDDKTLEKGNEVWPALVQAIDDSYLCIVVFSKDYASSTWCLRELTHIVESKKERQVIPVFYGVDPSHVRKQAGSYKTAFLKHEKDYPLGRETLTNWRASLNKAASFCGYDTASNDYRDEYQLIETIVIDVLQKFDFICPKVEAHGLVGINENCGHIEALLKKFQVIGLWGMSGIGKTTLARHVFNKYRSRYEGHCFLADIRKRSQELGYGGLYKLRNELFSELLKTNNIFQSRLNFMDIIVVLDDVDNVEQIEDLVGEPNYFGPRSRIIITTRDKNVLSGVDEVYEVKELSPRDSLRLFSLKAFGKDSPKIGFKDLSKKAIIYARGIPRVLKFMGSSLRGRGKEIWESRLKELKQHSHDKIQDTLRWSYEGLEEDVKNIFLDIAFFYKGHKKDEVERLLEDDYSSTKYGMEILLDRAFITIDLHGNTIEMHDLIQKFGWDMVRQECKDPKGRSRLRDFKEMCAVLKNNEGNDIVEGMILDMSQFPNLHIGDIFKKMTKLRIVKICSLNLWFGRACKLYLPSDLELLCDNSRHRHQHAFNECLSSIPCFKKHAAEHDIPDIYVRELEEQVQDLHILANWQGMEIIPNSSHRVSNPEWVRPGCKNLCYVHPAILSINMVVKTEFSWCIKLKSPRDDSHSTSRWDPSFQGFSSVRQFSLASAERRDLDTTGTLLKILPSSGHCFFKFEELFPRDLFTNFLNESCLPQRSLEEIRLRVVGELDKRNFRRIHDAFRSIEGPLFCESCNLSAPKLSLPESADFTSHLADCEVVAEEFWWKALDFDRLKHSSVSFFDVQKPENAVSRWARARTRAAKVGKGLSKDDKAQKLALPHWFGAI